MPITKHAKKRLKQRCNTKKSANGRMLSNAIERGLERKFCNGRLRKYLDSKYHSYQSNSKMYVYSNMVYILIGKTLITVYHLPANLQKMASEQIRGKND